MEQLEADPGVVKQLMFNRILAFVRSLSIDQVTVVGVDAKTGTIGATLAGVDFIVSVSVGDQPEPDAG